ncbi:sugar-specific transcriptional regulator TrmB [Methanoplanus sp. FWC-SCC4]|uniref:Sugar-specific transcriptional regulator TrmB n=1 Tax=Methanochimaera problematica TaxID=2609417 RepID=A0AA97I316_9EURY|nr:sugar-specific transcriptional regulator TrmB [Methanoplanus sp. FWC-SCC4]WOF16198.1 sugar-specific transcriptional regulator TrmB [Methanoplanus sp. FWC-SCC4]
MAGVLEKRRELLRHMRDLTLENGFFTVNDIAGLTNIPRSTVQDWVNRLIEEKCVLTREEKRGRFPARYITTSAMLQTACKRIFTTVDGENIAIFHECRSGGCAAFCRHHHSIAGGILTKAHREGTLLIEYAKLNDNDKEKKPNPSIGLYPASAVGVVGIKKSKDNIIQKIRCIGGPAYSLTDMMKMAEGVCDVTLEYNGNLVEGEVVTRALTHLIIGIDDTDTQEGGATFALALGLLQYLGKLNGVIPIGHRVVMLNPDLKECTAGNSCSFIEIAVKPEEVLHIKNLAVRFVEDESLSENWGIAIKCGFSISGSLRKYGMSARNKIINLDQSLKTAEENNLFVAGKKGIIGAVAAVSFRGLANEILLDPLKTPFDEL